MLCECGKIVCYTVDFCIERVPDQKIANPKAAHPLPHTYITGKPNLVAIAPINMPPSPMPRSSP